MAGLTNDYVRAATHGDADVELGLGLCAVSVEAIAVRERWPGGPTIASLAGAWRRAAAFFASAGLDLEVLRAESPADLIDLFRGVEPVPMPPVWVERVEIRFGTSFIHNDVCCIRLDRADGTLAGVASILKPALGGAVIAMLALGDERLFERQLRLTRPTRQPAAILFADLEGSTALSRQMSAADYFALLRRLIHRVDTRVVEAGGIVGKHAGDGVTAFFLAGDAGSESAAAAAAIRVARTLPADACAAAERSGLDSSDVVLRSGAHFGATLTIGQLLTAGRADVTALGDEVTRPRASRRAPPGAGRWVPRRWSSGSTRARPRRSGSCIPRSRCSPTWRPPPRRRGGMRQHCRCVSCSSRSGYGRIPPERRLRRPRSHGRRASCRR